MAVSSRVAPSYSIFRLVIRYYYTVFSGTAQGENIQIYASEILSPRKEESVSQPFQWLHVTQIIPLQHRIPKYLRPTGGRTSRALPGPAVHPPPDAQRFATLPHKSLTKKTAAQAAARPSANSWTASFASGGLYAGNRVASIRMHTGGSNFSIRLESRAENRMISRLFKTRSPPR